MARKQLSNYDAIRDQAPKDSFQHRDIRAEQNLERTRLEPVGGFRWYIPIAIAIAVIVLFCSYSLISLLVYGVHAIGSVVGDATGSISMSAGDVQLSTGGYTIVPTPDGAQYRWDSDGEMHDEPPSLEAETSGTTDVSGEVDADVDADAEFSVWQMFAPSFWNLFFSLLFAGITFLVAYLKLRKIWEAQQAQRNIKNDHTEDIWLQTTEEMLKNYDFFPDKAAHMSVSPSSLISHIGASNHGIKRVLVARRATEDIVDEDGDIIYAGTELRDENGSIIFDEVPLFDTEFRDECWDASKLPKDKDMRKAFDLSKVSYNPDGDNRDKLGKFKTVADLVNTDCEIPYYEVGRPGGLYIVDTAPVNTMVFA